MTPEERNLLIETARVVSSIARMIANRTTADEVCAPLTEAITAVKRQKIGRDALPPTRKRVKP